MFLVAKFFEEGILKEYLDNECEKRPSIFCEEKDKLPNNTSGFLLEPNSPINKNNLGWIKADKECAHIVKEIFTTPKYLLMFCTRFAKSTLNSYSMLILAMDNRYMA